MEKRDLYDSNKRLTGECFYVGDVVPKDKYYLVVMIFIQNNKGEFLIQKRSMAKGNKWATTGGHPKSGEDTLEGIYTEVKEELGIDISIYKSIKLFKTVKTDDCFVDLYYLRADIDIEQLNIQEEEVSDIKWCTENEIEKLIVDNQFHKSHIDAYRDCQKFLKK